MKYRIKEDGMRFYPQYKRWYKPFWECFEGNIEDVFFYTKKRANDYITGYIQATDKSPKKVTIHPYENI